MFSILCSHTLTIPVNTAIYSSKVVCFIPSINCCHIACAFIVQNSVLIFVLKNLSGCCIFAKKFPMNIAVLGAGMVGRVMAIDLAKNHNVTSIDISESNLQAAQKQTAAIKTIKADLKDYSSYKQLLQSYDLVVTAVPGF